MDPVPAFELGLWNAWIFMVPAIVVSLLCILLMTKKGAPQINSTHNESFKFYGK